MTEALTAGVPMVVLPFSTDQFAGAAAIEAAGLGTALDPNAVTSADLACRRARPSSTARPRTWPARSAKDYAGHRAATWPARPCSADDAARTVGALTCVGVDPGAQRVGCTKGPADAGPFIWSG